MGLMRWVTWVKIAIGHVSHYQNYCSGVISLKSSHCNSFEDWAPTVSFTVSDFHRDLSAWQGISLVVLAMATRRWVLYPLPLRESRNCASTCARVHISVTKWCTVGYFSGALWDLWDGTVRYGCLGSVSCLGSLLLTYIDLNSSMDNIKYKDYVYGRCQYKSTWKNKEYLRR